MSETLQVSDDTEATLQGDTQGDISGRTCWASFIVCGTAVIYTVTRQLVLIICSLTSVVALQDKPLSKQAYFSTKQQFLHVHQGGGGAS